MKIIRLILILALGGSLTYLTYKSQFGASITDVFTLGGLTLLAVIVLFWTITEDLRLYKKQKKVQSLVLTAICLIFITVILILGISITNHFNSPTLLKVYYNGDYNGTGIDFKTDGTYIFDNSSMGYSHYYSGKYYINGNKITLDRDTIDNLTNLRFLEVREKKTGYKTESNNELYLFQIDISNNIIPEATEYRVIIDNRRK